jgi:single-stranded DNA-binding protein
MDKTIFVTGVISHGLELRALASGRSHFAFVVRPDRERADDATGAHDFINVVTWDELARTLAGRLEQGQRVRIAGTLVERAWEDLAGKRHSRHELVADRVARLPR